MKQKNPELQCDSKSTVTPNFSVKKEKTSAREKNLQISDNIYSLYNFYRFYSLYSFYNIYRLKTSPPLLLTHAEDGFDILLVERLETGKDAASAGLTRHNGEVDCLNANFGESALQSQGGEEEI